MFEWLKNLKIFYFSSTLLYESEDSVVVWSQVKVVLIIFSVLYLVDDISI